MKRCKCLLVVAIAGLVLSLALVIPGGAVIAADIMVITSKNAPAENMDKDVIKKIFLGKKRTWADGSAIELVTLEKGDAHTTFLKAYVNKTVSQFSTFWRKKVFTGQGKLPKSFASEMELVEYVAGKNSAIGYVSGGADTTSVKVVSQK